MSSSLGVQRCTYTGRRDQACCMQEDPDPERTSRVPIVLGGSQCEGNEDSISSCTGFQRIGVSGTCTHEADVFLHCFDGDTSGKHHPPAPPTISFNRGNTKMKCSIEHLNTCRCSFRHQSSGMLTPWPKTYQLIS